jgi:cytochrome c oxidase assembly factor CtaG
VKPDESFVVERRIGAGWHHGALPARLGAAAPRGATFANLPRLVVFFFAVALTAAVFLSPLNWLNREYLFVRVAQYVFLCLFAVPAFFLSCTFDIALWGCPQRRGV